MITVSTDVIQQSVITDHVVYNAAFSQNADMSDNKFQLNDVKQRTKMINDIHHNAYSSIEEDTKESLPPQLRMNRAFTSESIVDDAMSSYQEFHEQQTSDAITELNHKITINKSDKAGIFDKIDIQTLAATHVKRQKSGLSLMISTDTDEKTDDRPSNMEKLLTPTIIMSIKIVFAEFSFDLKTNNIVLQITDADMTVEEVINETLAQFERTYAQTQLQSRFAIDYELRCVDDDDIEDLYEMQADELDPPLTRNAKIGEFVDKTQGNIAVAAHMALCCDKRRVKKSTLAIALAGDHKMNQRRKTMDKLHELAQAQHKQAIFIRVYIPGPRTETSVLLSIDCSTSASYTVRDLFNILNRKRTDIFSARYFDFYYKNRTKECGAIANGVSIMDIEQNDLIILPKILSKDMNAKEAFQFKLVRLANEAKQYKACKIDKYRTKKKAFLLEIDRYRFVKTSLETFTFSPIAKKKKNNQMKMPIAIQDIKSVVATEKLDGHHHHHNQFTITYFTQERKEKIKTYEMSSTQIRDEIVDKINFLCIIKRLQG